MKTLTDFKRALVLGSIWNCIDCRNGRSMGDRTVSVVQKNAVAFLTVNGTNSWLRFPKASDYEFNNGYAEIYQPANTFYSSPSELVLKYNTPRLLILKYKEVEL